MNAGNNPAPACGLRTVLAFFFCVVCIIGCDSDRSGIYPGEVAPNIIGVEPRSGEQLALHEVNGDVVLVNFWATWCAPCIQELPALQRFYDEVKGQGITVVGIAVNDSLPLVKETIATYNLTFPMILDDNGKSKLKYELRGFPESFVLDRDHRVLVVPDPAEGSLVTKIVGPRNWAHPSTVGLFTKVRKDITSHDSNTP